MPTILKGRKEHFVVQARIQILYFNALYKHYKDNPPSTQFLTCRIHKFTIRGYQPTKKKRRQQWNNWVCVRWNSRCPQVRQHKENYKHHLASDASNQQSVLFGWGGIRQPKALSLNTCYKQSTMEFKCNTMVVRELPGSAAYKTELRDRCEKEKWRRKGEPNSLLVLLQNTVP